MLLDVVVCKNQKPKLGKKADEQKDILRKGTKKKLTENWNKNRIKKTNQIKFNRTLLNGNKYQSKKKRREETEKTKTHTYFNRSA